MDKAKTYVAFVAAGSGGHVQSNIAVIENFQKRFPERKDDVLFVGSSLLMQGEKNKKSLEETLAERMGIRFLKVRTAKLQRTFTLSTLIAQWKLLLGFYDAVRIFLKYPIKKVVCFGGYSSLPMGVVGFLFGKEILIHEQTSSIGLTNRILRFVAARSLISYQESVPFFKRARQIVHVGSPSREYLFSVQNLSDLKRYGTVFEEDYLKKLAALQKSSQKFIFIMGGSQGSHVVNETLTALLSELVPKYDIFLQTGDNQVTKDFEKVSEYVSTLPVQLQEHIIIRKFIYEEMGFLYKQADLVIGRSGANSVYEAGMMHVPSIFIPIPWVTKNEQYTNAKILADLGLGEIIEEKDLTTDVLRVMIEKMLSIERSVDFAKIDEKFPRDSAERIVDLIVSA